MDNGDEQEVQKSRVKSEESVEESPAARTKEVNVEEVEVESVKVEENVEKFEKDEVLAQNEPPTETGIIDNSVMETESSPAQDPGCSPVGNNNNANPNTCMALLPITSKGSQMIPIAVLRKTPSGPSPITEENKSAPDGGIMQLITGKSSKVAPALPETANPETSATVGAAVLMLIPKKPDAVCVDITPSRENQQDTENNQVQQGSDIPSGSGQPDGIGVKPTTSCESYEEVCRICHDNPSKLELISPCLCKGSMSKVHRTCLERWLGESAKNSCEICGYEYNTVRKPKYTGCRSVYQWIRHPLSPSDTRNLFFDIACFFILTPLAAISSWLCVVGAQHYTFGEERRRRSKFHDPAWAVNGHPDPRADASNATWTSVGLLSLTGTLLVAYSVWLFVAIKYHVQAWREWQQRNFTVTIVPFEDGCMGRPPVPRPPRTNQQSPGGNNNNNSSSGLAGTGERNSSNNNNFYNMYGYPEEYLRYSGHSSLIRGRGRSTARHGSRRNRPRETYLNLPPIFSRSHFIRNPPPGYTISETALLYQALYGNDSDQYVHDNFLSFFADSSEDMTESTSNSNTTSHPSAQPTPHTEQGTPEHHSTSENRGGETETVLVLRNTPSINQVPQVSNNNNSFGGITTPSLNKEQASSLNGKNDVVVTVEENYSVKQGRPIFHDSEDDLYKI